VNPSTNWRLSGFGDEISPDPKIQAAVLSALGASAIEVRSAWSVNIVDLSSSQLRELKSILDDSGLEVSAIGSPIGKVPVDSPTGLEVERAKRAFEAANLLESKYVRIFSFYPVAGQDVDSNLEAVVEKLSLILRGAQENNLVLLHENEKDIFGDRPERILKLLENLNSQNFRLAWDSANFVQVGITDIPEAWEKLGEFVDYLQVKDARIADSEVVPPGEGDGGVEFVVQKLADRNYSGFASMEPHLSAAFSLGGFSGPAAFGIATRAFRAIAERNGVRLS